MAKGLVQEVFGVNNIIEVDTGKLDKTAKAYESLRSKAISNLQKLGKEFQLLQAQKEELADEIIILKGRIDAQREEIEEASSYITRFENLRAAIESED